VETPPTRRGGVVVVDRNGWAAMSVAVVYRVACRQTPQAVEWAPPVVRLVAEVVT